MQEEKKTEFEYLKCKIDENGYIESFDASETDKYKEYFEKYGFVVIRDVIDSNHCEETINDVWNEIEKNSGGTKRDDPTTWKNEFFISFFFFFFILQL